jgi:hypothetical protein
MAVIRIGLGLSMSVGRGSGSSSPWGGPALAQTTCLEKIAFLSQPYLPDTVIALIQPMATPHVIAAASSNLA